MLLQNPLKQLAAFILMSTVAIGFQSCSDDENEPSVEENALLTFTVPNDALWDGEEMKERGFVFLSDENGKLITSKEYKNGENVTLTSSEFKGDKFYLTQVVYYDGDVNGDGIDETQVNAWTYADFQRGQDWSVFYEKSAQDPEYVGDAKFTFTNYAEDSYYYGTTNGDEVDYNGEGTPSARLIKSPSLLYLTRNSEGTIRYNVFSNVVVGNNTINLNDVSKEHMFVTVQVPDGMSYMNSELTAFPNEKDYSNPYRIGDYYRNGPEDPSYKILFPGNAFQEYYVETFMENETIEYSNGARLTATLGFPEITSDVTMDFSNGKLTYAATGEFDFLTTGFRYDNDGDKAYWYYLLPKSSTSRSVPAFEIPEALKEYFPEFDAPLEYTINEHESIDSYNDFLDFVGKKEAGINAFNSPGTVYTEITYKYTSPNGRSASKSKRKRFCEIH
ncbi:hypothetical protein [Pseudochryseolinea flava]|uniref:Uncharacterized protein n=1 Tax=Pseudochryseolinea flava TaxID=2059302 RepID=A0A364YA18_9BACT|nr:hypothetical protein [Pseudochryseolinea flava]RAW02738.1 hypothetical protein DQQ10_01120 [Pseudochryseolinea flava]